MLAIYEHPASRGHVTPPGHPERVERMDAVEAALAAVDGLDRRAAPRAEDGPILRAHTAAYLEATDAAEPEQGWNSLDPDTHMSPGSVEAARRAAGANVAATDLVLLGGARAAFCATRPPGHHAERERAMGFCFYSNAAIAALHAIEAHGLSRVVVADFDVHHGNGTQDVVWEDPRVVFASSHQMPLYPGTGAPHETGAGNIFNAALGAHTGSKVFRAAWEQRLLPAMAKHEPELVIISAGFDAHKRDPLANIELEDEDFTWITERLCDLAGKYADGRVVSTLEGGYDLQALETATTAHLQVLEEHAR